MAATVIAAAVERAGVPAEAIEDVWFGAANQAGEDNRNVARMAALLAGLPESVAGVTVNRLCASGLSAVVGACHAVAAGDGDLFVAGGVESMSRAPLVMAKPEVPFPRGNRTGWAPTLGGRVGGKGARARGRAAGRVRRLCGRGGRSTRDGHRAGAGGAKAARARGRRRGRARPGRAERGVRVAEPGRDPRARARRGARQR